MYNNADEYIDISYTIHVLDPKKSVPHIILWYIYIKAEQASLVIQWYSNRPQI